MAALSDTSDADVLAEEIGKLASFLIHLDGYWQRAQRQGVSARHRLRLERYLAAAYRRIADLTAPLTTADDRPVSAD